MHHSPWLAPSTTTRLKTWQHLIYSLASSMNSVLLRSKHTRVLISSLRADCIFRRQQNVHEPCSHRCWQQSGSRVKPIPKIARVFTSRNLSSLATSKGSCRTHNCIRFKIHKIAINRTNDQRNCTFSSKVFVVYFSVFNHVAVIFRKLMVIIVAESRAKMPNSRNLWKIIDHNSSLLICFRWTQKKS